MLEQNGSIFAQIKNKANQKEYTGRENEIETQTIELNNAYALRRK